MYLQRGMRGDSHDTWGRRRIALLVPLEGDPMKERVAFTKKRYYVEVGVTASHFFVDDLISHIWKILEPTIVWLIFF
jgi:hypothetical protein